MATTAVISVASRPTESSATSRPAHHLNNSKNSFTNPWPSFRPHDISMMASMFLEMGTKAPNAPKDIETQIGFTKPTFGLNSAGTLAEPGKMKATWLGHACFLLELPCPEGATRGPRILFDPVFSHRCSPFQFMGPARYTKPPCDIDEIPPVDIIVISHNHYDHLDTHTIQTLEKLYQPHIFAPLGNGGYFSSIGIPKERTHIMDWWDTKDVQLNISENQPSFTITCTPCQHFTGRGVLDRFKSLWASWAIEDPQTGLKAWFGGDTAYRTVRDGEDEDEVPFCPEFKKIGEKFGSFDLAFIPIGAYEPRNFMSSIHCAPQDSVRIFKDVNAKRALGMHWGTWVLTTEDVLDPPKHLEKECEKIGIPKGAFDVCGLGETVTV